MSGFVDVLVDESIGASVEGRGGVVTTVYACAGLEEAQRRSEELGALWLADGWTKRHEVWVRGEDWRQKVIVIGGVV